MNDEWQFFPCSMGDDQAFVFLNVSIAEGISKAPATLAKLTLTYKSPKPDGLPAREEFQPVKEIEDRIGEFSEKTGDWYVGRITVAGTRRFYIYTARREQDWADFLKLLGDESGYEIALSYRDDPQHQGYKDDLYPTADDWQVIKDLGVIDCLKRDGDDGSAARKVDHWVYFSNRGASVDFVIWAENDRFTLEPEYSGERDDGSYCVRLFHHGTLKIGDISSHTIALRRKASEHGGEYDGWEAPVLSQDPT